MVGNTYVSQFDFSDVNEANFHIKPYTIEDWVEDLTLAAYYGL